MVNRRRFFGAAGVAIELWRRLPKKVARCEAIAAFAAAQAGGPLDLDAKLEAVSVEQLQATNQDVETGRIRRFTSTVQRPRCRYEYRHGTHECARHEFVRWDL